MECAVRRPIMLSIIWRVPKGFAHLTQLKGSASFRTIASLACAVSNNLGTSVIASSGHVFAHRPHCTQLRSMKRNTGASGASSKAASGHAPMQALQSVQVLLLTSIRPNGAPAARAMASLGAGALRAR